MSQNNLENASATSAIDKHMRNINLDLVKIIACIAVIGLHTLQRDISAFNACLYYLCGFAVPVFFMSSGYVLLDRNELPVIYSLKKIVRIIRLIVLWNLLVFSVDLLTAIIFKININDHIITLFIIEIIRSIILQGKLWQLWYLGALILLYCLLPLIYKITRNRKSLIIIWIILLVLSMLIQSASYKSGFPVQALVIQTFRLWTWLQYFMLGYITKIFLSNIFSKYISVRLHGFLLFLMSIIALTWQLFGCNMLIHNGYAEYFYDSIFIVVWCVSLFTFVMRLNLKDITKKL